MRKPRPSPALARPDNGVLPAGADGKPLNLDFEAGSLKDWTAEGDAFKDQPIEGDIPSGPNARGDKRADPQGKFWIGTFERLYDTPKGRLTSVPFQVTHPFATFLVGGGHHSETRVEIVRKDTNKVVFAASGRDDETMRRVGIDLREHTGKEIFIRLIDEHSGGWGHINFDDFRFHAAMPQLPKEPSVPVPDQYPYAGLSPEKAAEVMTVPEGFQVRLFAGEPDVQQPIAMAIDDRGRLWIAEAYAYPRRAPEGKGRDRILIFEDTDGDGRLRQAQGVYRRTEPGERLGAGLRRRVGRRRAVFVVHPGPESATTCPTACQWSTRRNRVSPFPRTCRRGRSAARRLGLAGHARDAELVHLGTRRLALRLSRRVHALARRQAGHARRTAHADQRRHLAIPSRAARVRGVCRGNEQSLGRRFQRLRPRILPRPASFRICITSFKADGISGRRASISTRTRTTTSRRSPTTCITSARTRTAATTRATRPAADTRTPGR